MNLSEDVIGREGNRSCSVSTNCGAYSMASQRPFSRPIPNPVVGDACHKSRLFTTDGSHLEVLVAEGVHATPGGVFC